MADKKHWDNNDLFSKRVKAGKRTYFFDVKATKSKDYYLTITESKRQQQGEQVSYEKHKIFLYKEDYVKFLNALQESLDYMKQELMPDYDFEEASAEPVELEPSISERLDSELKWE